MPKKKHPVWEGSFKIAIHKFREFEFFDLTKERLDHHRLFIKYLATKKCFDRVGLWVRGIKKVRCKNGNWVLVKLFVPSKNMRTFKIGYYRLRPSIMVDYEFVIYGFYFENIFISYIFDRESVPKVQSLNLRFNHFGRKNKYGHSLDHWELLKNK